MPRYVDDGGPPGLLGYTPGLARVQTALGRVHAPVRAPLHAHRHRARSMAHGAGVLRRLQEPPEPREPGFGFEAGGGGHRGQHQVRRVDVSVP